MSRVTVHAFHLPERLAMKADAALIAADDAHFARIGETLHNSLSRATARLDAMLNAPGGSGQAALERDLEIHRVNSQLTTLRRFGLDMCLGRLVASDGADPLYIGRMGLAGDDGQPLLVDWRTRAAEPYFAATHADPMGLVSRRRYRWAGGRVIDYWDEVFTADGVADNAAVDEQSAFIAGLGGARTARMRDVLATIRADQDAIIRAGSRGALVVDGGPGTGKTVVALHRAAYLLYADSRINRGSGGGVLVVGPHQPYLAYVEDVLPSLGEDQVQLCTLRDLVAEGATAPPEADTRIAGIKASGRLVDAIDNAVRLYEQPPLTDMVVATDWADVLLTATEWADAMDAEPGQPHNDARDGVWDALLGILTAKFDSEVPAAHARQALAQNDRLARAFGRGWPVLDPLGLVAALWTNADFLRRCAPWLSDTEVQLLQRDDGRAWTASDLPYLDAARQRIGDPAAGEVRRRREAAIAAEREYRADVADYLMQSSDDDLGLMSMLHGEDVQNSLDDHDALPRTSPDLLAGPFAHVIVDEAQELTDAEWRMLLSRCPSRSFTVVGDRAQARHGFTQSWVERLTRAGLRNITVSELTINYRTPAEIMAEAELVIRAAVPNANVPTSVRSGGVPVRRGARSGLEAIVASWLAENDEGTACVIGDPTFASSARVQSLTPELSKGLEFDLVVLVDPDRFGEGIEGVVDHYVAMTRATRELVVLEG